MSFVDVEDFGLERCERLLALHLNAAVARFGAGALSLIDLPSLGVDGEIEPHALKAAATLFWARHVEEAGIPSFADALADKVATGRLLLTLTGEGARKLMSYRRKREERFAENERRALYDRLFGDPQDPLSFSARLDQLSELLIEAELDRDRGAHRADMRARSLARQLAIELSARAAGITAFAGREIVEHIRAALSLLKNPEISAALGSGMGVWSTIHALSPEVLGRHVDPGPHLERASSGLALIEWLADASGRFEPNDRVLAAVGVARRSDRPFDRRANASVS